MLRFLVGSFQVPCTTNHFLKEPCIAFSKMEPNVYFLNLLELNLGFLYYTPFFSIL